MAEISRAVILQARQQGIEQLFITDPLAFSQKLLDGRIGQYKEVASLKKTIYFDRGIVDVVAYLDYFKTPYPEHFKQACRTYRYDKVFLLPPWREIYSPDNERYENFDQAKEIYSFLKQSYKAHGYTPIEVPLDSIAKRTAFIKAQLQ